jgi:hypothetical protein
MIKNNDIKLVLINLSFIVMVLSSCNKNHKVKLLNFTFIVPHDLFCDTVIDNNVSGKIIFDSDTIYFQFGYVINSLTEKDPEIAYIPEIKDSAQKHQFYMQMKNLGNVVVHNPYYDIDNYRKQNVFFEQIDNKKGKIILPRSVGNGITGLYIDSLKSSGRGTLSFHFFAKDLSHKKQEAVLKIIRSILFTSKINEL